MDKTPKSGHIQGVFYDLCRKILHNIYTGEIGAFFYLITNSYNACHIAPG
jgi:hypothetical protein